MLLLPDEECLEARSLVQQLGQVALRSHGPALRSSSESQPSWRAHACERPWGWADRARQLQSADPEAPDREGSRQGA